MPALASVSVRSWQLRRWHNHDFCKPDVFYLDTSLDPSWQPREPENVVEGDLPETNVAIVPMNLEILISQPIKSPLLVSSDTYSIPCSSPSLLVSALSSIPR